MGRPKKPYKTNSKTYKQWSDLKNRCDNPKHQAYKNYGGRGITYCPLWADYENFLADMGECPAGLSIDRVNNDGNYEPENCRWTTTKVQRSNSRQNRLLTFKGRTLNVTEWAEIYQIDRNALFARLRTGWSVEDALMTPIRKQKR
jgi:hypothetical protein